MPRKAPPIAPLSPDVPFYQRSHDGRASAYTPELGAWIAGRIADGVSLTGLCRHPDLPSIKTIYNWRDRHPDFAEMLAKAWARKSQGDRSIEASFREWRRAPNAPGRRRRYAPRTRLYSLRLAEAVCRRIADGETPAQIGADPAMPCRRTIYQWLNDRPEFAELYAEARDRQSEALFDLAWDAAREATPATVSVARLQFQVLRWRLGLTAPRKYGSAQDIEFDEPEVRVQVVRFFDDDPTPALPSPD